MSDAGVWRRRAAIALLGLFALAAAPGALHNTARAWSGLLAAADEDLVTRRRQVLGASYVDGIERLRLAMPVDAEYLLFDAGRVEEGARNWVRYDLAPRRAVFGGYLSELGRPERVRRRLRGKPATCVVAFPGDVAPAAMSHEEFIAWLTGRRETPGDSPSVALRVAPVPVRHGHAP